jgi:hypothetical protein
MFIVHFHPPLYKSSRQKRNRATKRFAKPKSVSGFAFNGVQYQSPGLSFQFVYSSNVQVCARWCFTISLCRSEFKDVMYPITVSISSDMVFPYPLVWGCQISSESRLRGGNLVLQRLSFKQCLSSIFIHPFTNQVGKRETERPNGLQNPRVSQVLLSMVYSTKVQVWAFNSCTVAMSKCVPDGALQFLCVEASSKMWCTPSQFRYHRIWFFPTLWCGGVRFRLSPVFEVAI